MRSLPIFILVLALLPGHLRASSVTYSAIVDTSSLAGTTGSLDFNFEPGPFGSQAATVQILNVGGSGTPSGAPTLSGDASGSLPGNLSLDNGTGFNDYFQGFTFGSSLSFDIMLGGPAVGSASPASSGSTFAFSIFSDANGTIPVLTSDLLNGYAITVDINSDGSTTLNNYTMGVTPEPSSGILAATGVLIAGFFLKRSRHQAMQRA